MRHRIVTNGKRFKAQTEINGEWWDEMEFMHDGHPVSAVKHLEVIDRSGGFHFHDPSEFRSRRAAERRIRKMYGIEAEIEASPWVTC